jgi:RHS repeat-associated protein
MRSLSLLLSLLCLPCLDPPITRATEDTRPQLQNSPRVATPDAVKTNPFSGSATYAYRFELPPGTGGLTPELVLTNSTATRHSEYGYGWSLDLGSIERSTRFGAPDYLDPGEPVGFDPASGDEDRRHRFEIDGELLVRDPSTPHRFHKRRADGTRILYFDSPAGNGYWEVTRADGTRYLYGSRDGASSELARSAVGAGAEVFRWALDEVIDARGNAYWIDYELDTHSIDSDTYALYVYPKEISYSHHRDGAAVDSSHALRRVVFGWQGRGDPWLAYDPGDLDAASADRPTSYRAGFKIQRRKRLAEVRVELASGEQIRRYELRYAPKVVHGDDGSGGYDFHGDIVRPNSELAEIQRYGSDDTAFPSSTRFEYTAADNDFLPPVPVPGTTGEIRVTHSMYSVGDTPSGEGLYDFDADGFLDRSPTLLGGGGLAANASGNFYGFGAIASPFTTSFDEHWEPISRSRYRDAFDWNQPPAGLDFGLRAEMVDLDGDGRVDRIEHRDCNGNPIDYEYCLLRNNGAGFDPPVPWPGLVDPESLGWTSRVVYVGDEEYITTQAIVDMNGDGLPDHAVEGSIYLNNGSGFDPPVAWWGASGVQMRASTRGLPSESHLDINGDGLPDRHVYGICIGGGNTYFNLGDRFQTGGGTGHSAYEGSCATRLTTIPASPETGLFGGSYSTLVDLNGDGVLDLVAANEWAPWRPFDASGPHWNVYYGLGDGRYFEDAGASLMEGSPVDGLDGIHGFTGHHWSIPGFRAPEMIEIGQGGSPPPPTAAGAYYIRYTESAGPPAQQWNGSVSDLVDLTGDGLPDFVDKGDSGGSWNLWRNAGPSGLLTRVINELGGTTEIEYLPGPHAARLGIAAAAMSYPGAPGDEDHASNGVTRRAIPGTWVVASIELSDGRADSVAVDLSETLRYREPRFDAVLRENLGFRQVEQTDALGARQRSLFHQVPELAGRPQASETLGLLGQLLESRETTWTALPASSLTASGPAATSVGGAHFAVPTGLRVRRYDPADPTAYTERNAARSFDPATGNLLVESESGHGALRTRTVDYAENWQDWLVSFPGTLETTLGGGGTTLDGPRIEYRYDSAGAGLPPTAGLVSERHTLHDGDHSGPHRVERWTYDAYGNQLAYFDGNAVAAGATTATRTTSWEADWRTFPATLTNALGETTAYTFDARYGKVATVLDPAGLLRCFEFDAFGRLAWHRRRSEAFAGAPFCDEALAVFRYHAIGNPDLQGVLESRFYRKKRQALWDIRAFDGLGRVYKEWRHAGGTHEGGDVDYFITLAGWDQRGRPACASLPFRGPLSSAASDCWTHEHGRSVVLDALGRPLARKLVADSTTTLEESIAYRVEDLDGDSWPDQVARITTVADSNRVVAQARDPWDEIVAIVADPSGERHRVELERDDLRRIIALREYADSSLVARTDIAYYQSGERKSLTPPGSAPAWSYQYDDSGNLTRQTSRTREVTRFEYDAANQLTYRDVEPHRASDSCCLSPGDARFDYRNGRLELESTLAFDASYEYYPSGDLRHEARTYHEGLDLTFSATHLYDRIGRRTLSIVPGGVWPARHYDGALLSGIQHFRDGIGFVVDDLEYHDSGSLSQIVYPSFGAGSLTASYGYASDTQRLSSARVQASDGAILRDYGYEHDTAGNLRAAHDWLPAKLSQTFDYDALFRLRSTTVTGMHSDLFESISTGLGRSFEYSPSGNLSRKGELTLEYGSQTNPTAGPHAIASVRDATQNVVGSYGYDANGAVTSISRAAGAVTLSLERDGNGRVARLCPDSSCSQAEVEDTHYRYDADGERVRSFRGGAHDRLAPFHWLDVDLVANTHELHYFAGAQRIASVTRTGLGHEGSTGNAFDSARYYHGDHVGSNTLVTDSSGRVLQESVLGPFGERLGTPRGSASANSYLLTDQPRDAESGLDYFGARYYDPWVGRFLGPDPSVFGPTPGTMFRSVPHAPESLNEYAYVTNRPTVMYDANGEVANFVAGALGGFAVGAGAELARQLFDGASPSTLDWRRAAWEGGKGAFIGSGLSLASGLIVSAGAFTLGQTAGVMFTGLLTGAQLESIWQAARIIATQVSPSTVFSTHLDPPVDPGPVPLPCERDGCVPRRPGVPGLPPETIGEIEEIDFSGEGTNPAGLVSFGSG